MHAFLSLYYPKIVRFHTIDSLSPLSCIISCFGFVNSFCCVFTLFWKVRWYLHCNPICSRNQATMCLFLLFIKPRRIKKTWMLSVCLFSLGSFLYQTLQHRKSKGNESVPVFLLGSQEILECYGDKFWYWNFSTFCSFLVETNIIMENGI